MFLDNENYKLLLIWLCRVGREQTVRSTTGIYNTIHYFYYSRRQQWVVWLSGIALASINVVALRQTQLVPGWVTVFHAKLKIWHRIFI